MQSAPTKPFGDPIQPRLGDANHLSRTAYSTQGSGGALQAVPRPAKERVVRVEINSNDRDVCTWPAASDFIWSFPFPVKNVKSMCLVGGTIPVPVYNIDAPFNTFTFNDGTKKVAVTIPAGAYTEALLATKLSAVLTAADGTNTYTAAVDPYTHILSITTSGVNTFGLLFGTGDYINEYGPGLLKIKNPALILGFVDVDAVSSGGILTAKYALNLNTYSRLYLHLNYDATMDLRSVLRGNGRYEPSAIIYCTDQDTAATHIKALHKDTYDNFIAPGLLIPRIRDLRISIRDEFYNIVNTNNRPVTLLFEIIVLDS
jgi:hypothetical protein